MKLSASIVPSHPPSVQAFTVVELLAIAGVLIVLSGVILPALAKSRPTSDLITCQDQLRRIGRGFSLYSSDASERLCPTAGLDQLVENTRPDKNYANRQQWCMGTMHSAPSWTNTALIQDSLLYPYVSSLAAYRCPADVSSTGSALAGVQTAKVRSVAVNCYLNPINPWSTGRVYRKQGDMVLGPAMTWIATEENPSSINDGWLIHPPALPQNPTWVDFPGSYHQQSGNLVFADDHVESHRWTDPVVLFYGRSSFGGQATGTDYRWLEERTTLPR